MFYMNKKERAVLLVCAIYLLIIFVVNVLWLYVFTTLFLLFLFVNIWAYRKFSYNASHLFTTIGRNYEKLVIGDDCDLSTVLDGKRSILFMSPQPRSMQAVEFLVKRLYSLLDEEKGELIIVMKRPDKNKGINVFDIPYLHENTLNDCGLTKMRYLCRLPLLFSFLGTIKLFLGISKDKPIEIKLDNPELVMFCESRHIKFKFYIIK